MSHESSHPHDRTTVVCVTLRGRRRSRRILRRAAVALISIAAGAAGCSTSDVEPNANSVVGVTLDRNVYSIGDTVRAVVRNLTGLTLEYPAGFCLIRLQRRNDNAPGDWNDVFPVDPINVACTLQAQTLGPHATAVFRKEIPRSAPGGVYRLLIPAPHASNESPREAASPLFAVGVVAVSGA